jgi:hypothetical protein
MSNTQEQPAQAGQVERRVIHSFNDDKGRRWTACCECNRGGNGNDQDKCACGWKCTTWDSTGCFLGVPIVGEPAKTPKRSRSKDRYQRFLEYGDSFDSFIDFCRWDAQPERSWNGGV